MYVMPCRMCDELQVIADNVGDNIGDISGMGSDLFGSYAESSCAALFVASICSFGAEHDLTAMMYPLLISAVGLLVCAITTVVATDVTEVKESDEVGPVLKRQILISAVLMTAGVAAVTPSSPCRPASPSSTSATTSTSRTGTCVCFVC